MTSRRRLRFALLALAGCVGAGCLNEYHPEFHPETSYRYTQNVSYPTTVVQNVVAPAAPSLPEAPRVGPPVRAPPIRVAAASPDPGGAALDRPSPRPDTNITARPALRPTGPDLDAQLSASCLADDPEACRRLAAIHLGHRRPGASSAVAMGNAFDTTVRTLGWRSGWAAVAGSNGGARGSGPRVALGSD